MREYWDKHNLLNDRKFINSVVLFCVVFLLSVLPLTLQAKPATASVPMKQDASAIMLMEQGDSCRLISRYNKALAYFEQALADPSVSDDTDLEFQLLERIMRTHDVLRHWKEMPESSYRLFMLAKEQNDSVYMAKALFIRGKRMLMLDQTEEGLRLCLEAQSTLKRCTFDHKAHEMAAHYGILAKMLESKGRYDEALHMSQLEEHYVDLSKASHDADWYRRNQIRTYTIRLEILTRMGLTAKADSLYRACHPPIATDPISGDALLYYFRERGMHAEALQFLDTAMRNIRADGDSAGRNMQRLLDDMGDTYYAMGDYKRSAECYAGVTAIADSLALRSLDDLTTEVRKVIDSERAIAVHRQWLIIIVAGVVLLTVISLILLRQGLLAHRKNQKMTALVNQLMHYRDIVIQNGNPVEASADEAVNAMNEEQRRFKEADKRIMKERLFANPDFGRDDLMRLLGVDKNTLPAILHKYAGTNAPGYINTKRMEYAVSLIKEHPEYTLESIAEACGIKSSATFIRNFKAAYDMTPSDYRKELAQANTDEMGQNWTLGGG